MLLFTLLNVSPLWFLQYRLLFYAPCNECRTFLDIKCFIVILGARAWHSARPYTRPCRLITERFVARSESFVPCSHTHKNKSPEREILP